MNDDNYGLSSICNKCHRPVFYVGDVPHGGFDKGQEPFCTCTFAHSPIQMDNYLQKRIYGLEERLNLIEEKIRLFDPEIVAKILLEDAKPKDSKREEDDEDKIEFCKNCGWDKMGCRCKIFTPNSLSEPKREATHEIVGKKTMQLLDSLDEPKREPWKPKEYCRCVYESDCHGIEMIKSPSGTEWAIGGTNTKDRWIFCPWCGGEIIR